MGHLHDTKSSKKNHMASGKNEVGVLTLKPCQVTHLGKMAEHGLKQDAREGHTGGCGSLGFCEVEEGGLPEIGGSEGRR